MKFVHLKVIYLKKVFIIFKTHLDIGFTDYSENVVKKYLQFYIPNAINVGYELKNSDTPFVWTVGSWLIWEALKNDRDSIVEKAIQDGILTWHALPFTTHTELMNKELFQYGLDISQKLDQKFGKKTIAAKMTDVPGHTIGMVPLLYEKGIKFLHIGVNPATPLPPIPDLFKWKLKDSQIIVMYQGDYGEAAEFEDFVIYFAHTNDNCGPQSADEIISIYKDVHKKYPGCNLQAATLNDVAAYVEKTENIPTVEKEIGDTWIHGAGTDPVKLAHYRGVLRHISEYGVPDVDLTENLLLVPEHTWGMDLKTFFRNDTDYTHIQMDELPEERATIEKSWNEQRKYVYAAEKLLGIKADCVATKPDLTKWVETDLHDEIDFEISWQIFDNSDYERYKNTYMRATPDWAIWDFTKVGMPEGSGGTYKAFVTNAYKCGQNKLYKLTFDKNISEEYGLPYFYVTKSDDFIEICWFGKKASRISQACWLKLKGFYEEWEVNKLGEWIDIRDIIGSPLICAVDRGVRNKDVEIQPLDSALVAPFGKRLLQYSSGYPEQDLHFNLYNNIWNTNFPMWYSDDALFRFNICKRKYFT